MNDFAEREIRETKVVNFYRKKVLRFVFSTFCGAAWLTYILHGEKSGAYTDASLLYAKGGRAGMRSIHDERVVALLSHHM